MRLKLNQSQIHALVVKIQGIKKAQLDAEKAKLLKDKGLLITAGEYQNVIIKAKNTVAKIPIEIEVKLPYMTGWQSDDISVERIVEAIVDNKLASKYDAISREVIESEVILASIDSQDIATILKKFGIESGF